MSIPHENVFILTKSLFCLNHPVLMFMGSKEQTPFCNHSFPARGGLGPHAPCPTECYIREEWFVSSPFSPR